MVLQHLHTWQYVMGYSTTKVMSFTSVLAYKYTNNATNTNYFMTF